MRRIPDSNICFSWTTRGVNFYIDKSWMDLLDCADYIFVLLYYFHYFGLRR
ncbi:MAG: hypothetical protein KDH90_19870 [Anaerolineae bacterium]|nr:hypothetical protein [Anaerolineae bacterium]